MIDNDEPTTAVERKNSATPRAKREPLLRTSYRLLAKVVICPFVSQSACLRPSPPPVGAAKSANRAYHISMTNKTRDRRGLYRMFLATISPLDITTHFHAGVVGAKKKKEKKSLSLEQTNTLRPNFTSHQKSQPGTRPSIERLNSFYPCFSRQGPSVDPFLPRFL